MAWLSQLCHHHSERLVHYFQQTVLYNCEERVKQNPVMVLPVITANSFATVIKVPVHGV
jgi:hypothetical protein